MSMYFILARQDEEKESTFIPLAFYFPTCERLESQEEQGISLWTKMLATTWLCALIYRCVTDVLELSHLMPFFC